MNETEIADQLRELTAERFESLRSEIVYILRSLADSIESTEIPTNLHNMQPNYFYVAKDITHKVDHLPTRLDTSRLFEAVRDIQTTNYERPGA